MQELDLNYPSAKGKIYSEEEDRYLLVRLAYYGLGADDVFERIKKDITEFPVFRFDWFFKSRTPQELSRRANTLLGMIAKEDEEKGPEREKDGSLEDAHEPSKKSKVSSALFSQLSNVFFRSERLTKCRKVRKHPDPQPQQSQLRRKNLPLLPIRNRRSRLLDVYVIYSKLYVNQVFTIRIPARLDYSFREVLKL